MFMFKCRTMLENFHVYRKLKALCTYMCLVYALYYHEIFCPTRVINHNSPIKAYLSLKWNEKVCDDSRKTQSLQD